MGWIEFESFGVFCPCFDDEFIGRQTLESFEPAGIVVCVDEVGEVGFELLMPVVMVALDGGFFDRPVQYVIRGAFPVRLCFSKNSVMVSPSGTRGAGSTKVRAGRR